MTTGEIQGSQLIRLMEGGKKGGNAFVRERGQ
jgi:molybdenum-dependent DNA-binding transcriptional regulator ModE